MEHDEGEKLLGEKLGHEKIEVVLRMLLQFFFLMSLIFHPPIFHPILMRFADNLEWDR